MSRFGRWVLVGALLVALASDRPATAQIVRVGSEFQVNVRTASSQREADVGVATNGSFVVVWLSQGQDGYAYGVFGRRFASTGAAVGAEFQINGYTSNYQVQAALAVGSDGRFVVAWSSYGQDGDNYGIFARRFDSAGQAQAVEFQVNLTTESYQYLPDVAIAGNGAFVITWASNEQDGSGLGVFARRFDAAGSGLGGELQVNEHTELRQLKPSVSAGADGRFVVAWEDEGQDGDGYGVFLQIFDSAGVAMNPSDYLVNTFTTSAQRDAVIDLASDGSFVVVWTSGNHDGFDYGVFGQRFDSGGDPQGPEIPINDVKPEAQQLADVQSDGAKGFIVTWESEYQDGSGTGVFLRRFDSSGAALSGDIQVALHTEDDQGRPSIGLGGNGRFVVAWQSEGQDGSGLGVFAQRFVKLSVLDIDGNGQITPLTDGLLALRYAFGFTGATLTTGVVDLAGCTRCDAASIEAYLGSLP